MASGQRITTGQVDFSGGVDSNRVPTIASPGNPHGLKPNQLAWLINGTVRGGGITQRTGWERIGAIPVDGLFQEAKMYDPINGDPYIIAQIAGRTFTIRVDTDNSVNEVTVGGDPNPAAATQAWMCQGERFMVIQDGSSVPLVWDGSTLQRIATVGNPAHPKLPAGQAMDYYMGRIWLANGREYIAGDIVGTPGSVSSGTAPYDYTDSILNITENTFLTLGGTFIVPTNAGNIRALAHNANLDTQLGEGLLFVFTRNSIYSVNVTPTRTQWAALEEPIQRVAQINFGTTSDRSIVAVNGDLFYQATDGVRSLTMAIRYFEQWGNVGLSDEERRATDLNDRSLLRYGSGINFDNRLWQTVLPEECPAGVCHAGIMPLDFDLISTIGERLPPAWEGLLEGLKVLRLLEADFGGRQRAFALVWSELNEQIEVWEFTTTSRFDENESGEARVTTVVETPSYTWSNPFELKELETLELWVDKIFGRVEFTAYFRPDQYPCWVYWHHWEECAQRNECDAPDALPTCYPTQTYREQFRSTMVLPKPVAGCDRTNARPLIYGYSFQIRLVIKGWHRIRGILVHANPRDKGAFEGLVCNTQATTNPTPTEVLPRAILGTDDTAILATDDTAILEA